MMPSCNALHQPRTDKIDQSQGREEPADAIECMRQVRRTESRLHERRTDRELHHYRANIHEQALTMQPPLRQYHRHHRQHCDDVEQIQLTYLRLGKVNRYQAYTCPPQQTYRHVSRNCTSCRIQKA